MNFDNPEISYFSNILSRSNTGSVPILLLYSLGFSESLILNELLNKRDAYRNARTKLLETNEGYDAFVEGSFFPCPDIELYASTGYEPQKIKRNLNTLVTEKLIVVKKAIAKVGPYKGQPIRHAKISPDIDELLLSLADEGAANIKKSCPELLVPYSPLDKEKIQYLLNHWKLVVNRYLAHTISAQGSAIYNLIVSEAIHRRVDEYGPFRVDYSTLLATLNMCRPTLDKNLKKLSDLGIIQLRSSSLGTFVEPKMREEVVKQSLKCGEKIHDLIKTKTGILKKEFELIKQQIENIRTEFFSSSEVSPVQIKMEDAKQYLIAQDIPWSEKIEERYLRITDIIKKNLENKTVITGEGIISKQGFEERFNNMPTSNLAHLISYLTIYDFEIKNLETYITTCIWNDNGHPKTISAEDLSYLKIIR